MDQLLDKQAVDQFFDTPTEAPDAQEGGGIGSEFTQLKDTSSTEYYSPARKGGLSDPAPPADPTPPNDPVPDHTPPIDPIPDEPGQKNVDYVSENLSLKQQIAELQLYKPLGDMITRNPNFLQAVEASLKTMPKADEPAKIERPVPPVKPAAYDASEAISVPGSESWKFREAQEGFQNEMFNYFEKRDAQREELQNRAVASYQAKQAEMEAHERTVNELQTKFGYSSDDVQDFIRVMSNPESRSLANLVKLHSLQRQQRAAALPAAAKAAQKNVPLPVGITGGGGSGQYKQPSDSELFNIGLGSARR